MRSIFVLIALIMAAGMASADWYPQNVYNFSGTIEQDTTLAAGKYFVAAEGAGYFDLSAATGVFKTTSGEVTIGGGTNNITLDGPVWGASGKDWTMAGASTFVLGSDGMDSVGGTINLLDGVAGTSGAFSGTIQAEQLTSTDDALIMDDLTVQGGIGVTETVTAEQLTSTDDATIADDLTVVGDVVAGSVTSGSSITATTTVQGEQLTSTDDVLITDDLTVDGAARIDETATINAVTINETLTVTGATTLSTLSVGVNATTTIDTTLTSADTKTVYGLDGSGASVTMTLPDAATVTGRIYIIPAAADMGANNIVVATTGAGKLGGAGGADTLTSTDASASLAVVSDGTNYLIISKVGTWT